MHRREEDSLEISAEISAAAARVRHAEADLAETVTRARSAGVTWQQVGAALGVSRQAAFKRFGQAVDPQSGAVLIGEPVELDSVVTIFRWIAAGEIDRVRALMTASCARTLTAATILDVWRDVLVEVGELEKCTGLQARTPDGDLLTGCSDLRAPVVLRVVLEHEAGSMVGHVSLNREGLINGLVIGRASAESSLPF